MRIVDAEHHNAVGKMVPGYQNGPLKVGDEVASRILR
jgi:hypothetical protein